MKIDSNKLQKIFETSLEILDEASNLDQMFSPAGIKLFQEIESDPLSTIEILSSKKGEKLSLSETNSDENKIRLTAIFYSGLVKNHIDSSSLGSFIFSNFKKVDDAISSMFLFANPNLWSLIESKDITNSSLFQLYVCSINPSLVVDLKEEPTPTLCKFIVGSLYPKNNFKDKEDITAFVAFSKQLQGQARTFLLNQKTKITKFIHP